MTDTSVVELIEDVDKIVNQLKKNRRDWRGVPGWSVYESAIGRLESAASELRQAHRFLGDAIRERSGRAHHWEGY